MHYGATDDSEAAFHAREEAAGARMVTHVNSLVAQFGDVKGIAVVGDLTHVMNNDAFWQFDRLYNSMAPSVPKYLGLGNHGTRAELLMLRSLRSSRVAVRRTDPLTVVLALALARARACPSQTTGTAKRTTGGSH